MHVILSCPNLLSANFTECNKQINDIKCTNVLHVLFALIKYLNKTSQSDHLWSDFRIIIHILHVSLELLSTLSLGGYCHFMEPLDVISDITTTALSCTNGVQNSSCGESRYQYLYFDIFIILWWQLKVVKHNMSTLSWQNMNLYK